MAALPPQLAVSSVPMNTTPARSMTTRLPCTSRHCVGGAQPEQRLHADASWRFAMYLIVLGGELWAEQTPDCLVSAGSECP